jgi:hypothetical protein
MGMSESGGPTYVDNFGPSGSRDQYPAWSSERNIPLSKEEIEDIFLDLTQKFGFQRDSMRNMVGLPSSGGLHAMVLTTNHSSTLPCRSSTHGRRG